MVKRIWDNVVFYSQKRGYKEPQYVCSSSIDERVFQGNSFLHIISVSAQNEAHIRQLIYVQTKEK